MSDAAPEPGHGFSARISRRVGPLPLYAWVALAVGVWAFYTRNKRPQTSDAVTGRAESLDPIRGELLDLIRANTRAVEALTRALHAPRPISEDRATEVKRS